MKIRILSVLALFILAQGAMAGRYDEIVERLRSINAQYPTMSQIVSLGTNDQGTEILGLRIEAPFTSSDQKVNKLLVGTHHGNEVDAAPLTVEYASTLLEIFENGDNLFSLSLKDSVFYVFPVLNISGYDRRRREEQDAKGRWHDPNRDYPDVCTEHSYFKLKSIKNLAGFVAEKDIVSAVTVHGYIGTFTFPFGFYTEDDQSPDHNLFVDATTYAVEANGYSVGTHKAVIYPAVGTFEDWAYLQYGVWVALLEMSRGAVYSQDVNALLRYFSVVPRERSSDHSFSGDCIRDQSRQSTMSRP